MPKYLYQVRDGAGVTATGALSAGSVSEAARLLRGEGRVVVDIREQEAATAARRQVRKRARPDEVVFFATQLAVMVDTGVPLPEALDAIAEQTDHEGFKAILTDVSEQVKGGIELSTALKRYPKAFSQLFVSMVRASEASGTMGQMLQRIARYLRQQRQALAKVKGAMTYPVAMLGFCVLVVVSMLVFILPRFEKIYASKSALLPLPTRFLLGLSRGLVTYWPFIVGGLLAAGVGAYLYARRPEGKAMLDKLRLDLPVIGKMYRRACIARSLRTMATMISTGVNMLEALEITAEVAGNSLYSAIWRGLAERVKGGSGLSEQMANHSLMPRSVVRMVDAGERTGKLGTVLDRAAEFCEEDLDVSIRAATSLIEPAMIIIMGFVVGGVAMALLLPIFSLSRVVAH